MKLGLLEHLRQRPDLLLEDIGCHSAQIVRYPYYAAKVAGAQAAGGADRAS